MESYNEERVICDKSRKSVSLKNEKTYLLKRHTEIKSTDQITKYGSCNFNTLPCPTSKTELINDSEERKSECCEQTESGYQSEKLYFDNLAISVEENSIRSLKQCSVVVEKEEKINYNHQSVQKPGHSSVTYISIQRNIIDDEELNKKYGKPLQRDSAIKQIAKCCRCNPIPCFFSLFPVFNWLPNYPFKQYILSDIVAGFTIAVFQIPQGMAYSLLASVDAIYGLYVSFFPVLIYFLMGTSRHISIGTFAIISIMLSNTVAKFEASHGEFTSIPKSLNNISTTEDVTIPSHFQYKNDWPPTKLEIVVSTAVVVGFWQMAMGMLRLGIINVILSDQLISGFTTGAAVDAATSQLKDLFGIKINKYNGLLQVIRTIIDIFKNLKYSNVATILISAISLFILAVVKNHINDRFQNKLIMPIPIDFIIIVIGTVVSYYGNLNIYYKVEVMGKIPTGLPMPQLPRADIFTSLIADSFSIAIVVFAITISMAKMFAKKHHYEINSNQELIALGSANIFSSFFLCYPCATSLSRSLLLERTGGKTQLANFISCLFILIVLLCLAPLFSALPKCILSAIIIVALKGMFLQIIDFWKAWKISHLDAVVWMVAFLSVVLTSIDFGLLISVCFTVFVVLIRIVIPHLTVLGNLPETEMYLDIERYECNEISKMKIYHYGGVLCFLNREYFKNSLMENIFKCPSKKIIFNNKMPSINYEDIKYVILDCSSISFLDLSALNTLSEIKDELREHGIRLVFCNCPAFIYEMLEKSNFFEDTNFPHFFSSIHDAVLHCQNNMNIYL